MTKTRRAKFNLGQIVRHRDHAFRGLVVDADAVYAGAPGDPDGRDRERPFYRILAMGEDSGFLVYASEAVLEVDPDAVPLSRDDAAQWFSTDSQGRLAPRSHPIQ